MNHHEGQASGTPEERRDPHGDDTVAIGELAASLLAQLDASSAGRVGRTVLAGPRMRATLIALAEGAELAEHEAPPAATLHVLSGEATVHGQDRAWRVREGELVAIPAERHSLSAHTTSVVLLTVALAP